MEAQFRALVKEALELDNVDWGVNEEGTFFPAAILYTAMEEISRNFAGANHLKKSIVRVDLHSVDVTECISLKHKLMAIDGFSGDADSSIEAVQLVAAKQSHSKTDNDYTTHRYSVDFHVWHY